MYHMLVWPHKHIVLLTSIETTLGGLLYFIQLVTLSHLKPLTVPSEFQMRETTDYKTDFIYIKGQVQKNISNSKNRSGVKIKTIHAK